MERPAAPARAAGTSRQTCPILVLCWAGIMLEVLPFAVPLAFLSSASSWDEFAESVGFAAVGAVMTVVL